ncbi:hypothetical protein QA634_34870 [Methylobacterium sp. CB376]|uniref:hypothetical protein n=1 Tax=unclassified Methylobacterium TaxID=2615210 RepID=UPI000152CE17|nr:MULTISPECIES: hypothetical protein [Methylobacterium]WFT80292.1 hypothetical protein QA634_34870 [Methylobacterium nodulans]
MVDRVALAGHRDLGLTEAHIRGALAVLEAIGFVERVEVAGSAYHRTAVGSQRKPVQWRFGVEYLPAFSAANEREQRARGARSPAHRPPPAAAIRPPAANVVTPRAILPSQVARIDSPALASLYSGEQVRPEPNPGREAALARLGQGLGLAG